MCSNIWVPKSGQRCAAQRGTYFNGKNAIERCTRLAAKGQKIKLVDVAVRRPRVTQNGANARTRSSYQVNTVKFRKPLAAATLSMCAFCMGRNKAKKIAETQSKIFHNKFVRLDVTDLSGTVAARKNLCLWKPLAQKELVCFFKKKIRNKAALWMPRHSPTRPPNHNRGPKCAYPCRRPAALCTTQRTFC